MIRFDRVTKLYSGNTKPALNGVDVEIKAGEFVFLVGASGSGKSSFLRLVLKEDKPTSGEIHVLGQRLDRISSRKVPYFRRSLGVVFQDFRLLPGRTVYQNVAFTLQVIGKSRGFIQEAVPDVLKMVGLDGKAERLPHELSGGEQQRVAIARAVVNKPAILLADEPTGNLDPATSAGIMQVLELINAGGTTVVMATHDVSIVDSMKRRVIELVGGNIIRDEVEGGYTTSIPVQQQPAAQAAPATQSAPVITGAAAFAAAIAEEAGPVELPTSPRTVVEGSPNRYADLPDYDAYPMTAPIAVPTITGAIPRINAAPATHSVPEPAAPASPQPPAPLAPAAARAPLAPSEPAQTRRAARTAEVQRLQPRLHTPEPQPQAAPAAEAAVAPTPTEPSQPAQDPLRHLLAGRAQAPSHDQSPPAAAPNDEPEQHDDPLALAVRLGLRRPGAAPESTSSQEVGPTS